MKILFFGLLLIFAPLSAKVRILTFHCVWPQFIELQHKSLQKFMRDDYELIVFNDGSTPEREKAIREMCEKYDIQCVRYEQQWHLSNPLNDRIQQWESDPKIYTKHFPFHLGQSIENQSSARHCHVIQYALDHFGYNHDDIVVIMDGDALFIRPFSVRLLLRNCDIAGIQKLISTENVEYFWVVFIAFSPQKMPNLKDLKFGMDLINNTVHDSGAASYHYLKNNPGVIAKKFLGYASTGFHHWTPEQIRAYGFRENEIGLIKNLPWPHCVEFHMDKKLLHFGAGSLISDPNDVKLKYVAGFMNELLEK